MSESIRIDKWLWYARFFRTRTLAQEKAAAGYIRLNGHRVEKASVAVKVGDVLTLPAMGKVVALRVVSLGTRRGPSPEARTLYEMIEE